MTTLPSQGRRSYLEDGVERDLEVWQLALEVGHALEVCEEAARDRLVTHHEHVLLCEPCMRHVRATRQKNTGGKKRRKVASEKHAARATYARPLELHDPGLEALHDVSIRLATWVACVVFVFYALLVHVGVLCLQADTRVRGCCQWVWKVRPQSARM